MRKLACRLSSDEISEEAKKDLLIILHGNLEAFKLTFKLPQTTNSCTNEITGKIATGAEKRK